jgi:hypothetical protein
MAIPTFAWNATKDTMLSTNNPRLRIRDLAMHWQEMAGDGALSELASMDGFAGPPDQLKLNYVNEITGLMGSAGEQLALAWTAEQDVQRWSQTRTGRDKFHQRIGVRALAELSAHFCLGVTHNLGNTVLRVLLLNNDASDYLARKLGRGRKMFTYVPGSTVRDSWQTVSPSSGKFLLYLQDAAKLTQAAPCEDLAEVVQELCADSRFIALDERRGMDFHRHRPQSLNTGSPREGAWKNNQGEGWRSIEMHIATPELDNDEDRISATIEGGLESLADALEAAYPLIIASVSALGYKIFGRP